MEKTNTVLAGLMRTEENLKEKAKDLAENKPSESKPETAKAGHEPSHSGDAANTGPNSTAQKAKAVK